VRQAKGFVLLGTVQIVWRSRCFYEWREAAMNILNHIKITPRDAQVLKLLVQGCSNKEIAAQLSISPRTVKQHLRTLFLRAGIRDGRKRVKLATAMFQKEQMESCLRATG
jgi:DNA-binding NarL/FixJ family response regulator